MPGGKPTVHVLFGGQALCGKEGPPNLWPPTHRWIGLDQFQLATCFECLSKADKHPQRPGNAVAGPPVRKP